MEDKPDQTELDRFILERIESVPRVEALLLVWRNRPRTWTAEQMSAMLYLNIATTRNILEGLVRDDLLAAAPTSPKQYSYVSRSMRQDMLLSALDETYRQELVRITNLIHSKPPAAVRSFARAFQIKKERE